MVAGYLYNANVTQATCAMLRVQAHLMSLHPTAVVSVRVGIDFRTADTRARSAAMWISRLMRPSIVHSLVHDFNLAVSMCALGFVGIRVVAVKFLSGR